MADLPQALDHLLHQHLRGRSPGRHAETALAHEPLRLHVFDAVDQIRFAAQPLGQLFQTIGIRAVRRAHHQHQLTLQRELLHRVLTILRGITDVLLARPFDVRKAFTQGINDPGRIVHRQRGLRDIGQVFGVMHLQFLHVLDGLDKIDLATGTRVVLPHRALHFRVELMADEDALTSALAEPDHFQMHFRHQRAGRVEHFEATLFGLFLYRLGNTMGAEHDDGGTSGRINSGNVREFVHEDGAALAQRVHDKLVMHYLVSHINRCAVDVQRPVDDVDGTVHAGAEPAWIGEMNMGRLTLRGFLNLHCAHSLNSITCTPAGITENISAVKRIARPESG